MSVFKVVLSVLLEDELLDEELLELEDEELLLELRQLEEDDEDRLELELEELPPPKSAARKLSKVAGGKKASWNFKITPTYWPDEMAESVMLIQVVSPTSSTEIVVPFAVNFKENGFGGVSSLAAGLLSNSVKVPVTHL